MRNEITLLMAKASIKKIFTALSGLIFALLFSACSSDKFPDSATDLESGFVNPPAASKPRTWFHAMSGNMTKAGLTKDLEAVEKAGIGGILLFNVTQGIPNGPVKYNSDEHLELIKHAAAECERLGLDFGVHNCDGWSSSGGPWITPEQSMKMVVWSETVSEGGMIELQLPQPTTREGLYRDIALIAYPALKSEILDFESPPVVTSSDKGFNLRMATDNRLDSATTIQKRDDQDPWIQFEYEKPRDIRSVFMVFNDREGEAVLQVSDDGKNFKMVKELYKVRTGKGEWAINDSFEPVRSKYFRLLLNQTMAVKEARLLSTYSLHNVLGRTSIGRTEDVNMTPIGQPEAEMVIDKNSVLDISAGLNAEGFLKTTLPEGTWTILRFGYTSTGAFNHPASDEGRGLECDKFSREAFKIHYDAFVGRVISHTAEVAPNAMQYVEIDSYEMGGQNWTQGYDTIFREEKGYGLLSFLPLFTGRFVESAGASDAVLSDIRDLNCKLMSENYFGYFSELCRRDGIKCYIEPYGFGPLNDLDVGGKADINMGEFWMNREMKMVQSAVSASHIYGKNVVSAESFTTEPGINWKGHPGMAKISGDKAWALGINEFMFHRYAHQANTNVKPGMTMNRWGFHFDRTQTWWENAGASWFKYIARGSYLLRQGIPVSDLLVFVGDGSPNSVVFRNDFQPAVPAGTNFDCVNADVLLNRIQIKNKRLVLPEGTEYRMLVLNNCKTLTLKTLQRIHEISKSGVPVVGEKASQIAGYNVPEEEVALFSKLADEIWSSPNTWSDFDWNAIFAKENLQPDLKIAERSDIDFIHRRHKDTDIYFLHNPGPVAQRFECDFRIEEKIPELWDAMTGEIRKSGQFVSSGEITKVWIDLDPEESVFVVFRENAKNVVSVSDPKQAIKYFLDDNNRLVMEIAENGKYETRLTNGENSLVEINGISGPYQINGTWEVEFLKEHDYPDKHVFAELTDWRDNENVNIRYYSGTAIYRTAFNWDGPGLDPENRYSLDLGDVKIVAEVILNGKNAGVLWMAPFSADISDALQAGENQLEIRVTNQWSNRLIGDERFPAQDGGYKLEGQFPKGRMPGWYVNNEPMPSGPRTTFCTGRFYKDTDELMPSGLLGPVQIAMKKRTGVVRHSSAGG
jgi:hypothetical protein